MQHNGDYPVTLEGFHRYHQNETCLVVCNGPSLKELPVGFLEQYPSFGCNTIVQWGLFKPTYYVAVDHRVYREFGELVNDKYADIPKFIPRPNLDDWEGPLIYRWFHRPGALWPYAKIGLWPSNILSDKGITYSCCPHVMMQLAYYMGFTTILIVGMDHSDNRKEHAWGIDEDMPGLVENSHKLWRKWEKGHKELCEGFAENGVSMINITPNTQEKVLPKGNWQEWHN